jgi:hypothetical protein
MQPEALSLGQDHPGAEQQNECNLSVEIQAWQMENGEEKKSIGPIPRLRTPRVGKSI